MKKHLVLDIDECLLRSFSKGKNVYCDIVHNPKYTRLRSRIHTISNGILSCKNPSDYNIKLRVWYIERPYMYEFLKFCQEYFETVSIWSAGSYSYVHEISQKIFRNLKPPHLIMTNKDIVYENGGYYKPLSNYYKLNPDANPKNTLMLDNMEHNFLKNKNNGVTIPDFKPSTKNMDSFLKDDINLLLFQAWLLQDEVINSKDVRKLDKTSIFHSNTNISTTLSPTRRMYIKPSGIAVGSN